MQIDNISLIVGILTLMVVVLSPLIGLVATLRQAARNSQDEQRKERLSYLQGKMDELILTRSNLQAFHRADIGRNPEQRERDLSHGKAYALLIAVGDEEMRRIAPQLMSGKAWEERFAALDAGIARLGDIILNETRGK